MTRLRVTVPLVAALAALAAACGGGRQEPPITIGVLSACEGIWAEFYDITLAGAELPLIRRGGTLAGPKLTDGVRGVTIGRRPVRLVFGCSDSTAGSAIGEARRLVERAGADVLIGPFTGEEGVVVREYARRRRETTFVNGTASDPALQAGGHPPNTFRFSIDGAQAMAGIGSYAYRTLGWRTAVTIAAPDPYQWAQHAGFVAEFCALGGSIVKRIWLRSADDAAKAAERVPAGADGVLVVSGPQIVLALAQRYKESEGGPFRRILGGALAIDYQDPRFNGAVFPDATVSGYPPGVKITGGPPGREYMRQFRRTFPTVAAPPGQIFDTYYGAGMEAVLEALDAVDGDLSGGQRKFREALGRIELDPFYGHIRLDRYHQAIGPNYVVRQEGKSIRVLKMLESVEQTFNGYFSPDDPPPSGTTPACKKGNPPLWARR